MSTLTSQLLDLLAASGVEVIFGFPGETSLPLYVELQRRGRAPRHVLARCPRGAGYMADAYARIKGTLAVADSPGGIGSPFVAPCAHEANNSSVPVLFIASAESTKADTRWTTSSCDQQGMFGALTKATFRVESAGGFGATVAKALRAVTTPPLGPVFLELPTNFLEKPAGAAPPPEPTGAPPRRLSDGVAAKVAEALRGHARVALIAGGGCHLVRAGELVGALVDRTGLPFATTLNGKGLLPETHPRSLGVCGGKGLMSANDFLASMDCLLVLGSKLGDKSLNYGQLGHDRQLVVHVNDNPAHLGAPRERYWPIQRPLETLLLELLDEKLPSLAALEVPAQAPFWPRTPTAELCDYLTEHLPAGAVVAADASVARGWAGAAIRFSYPGQRLITPAGSGSLSYALPAAIGAQIARPDRRVVGLGGDGGLIMALHDMETARRLDLPIAFFLLDNNRLGLIDQYSQRFCGGGPISADFVPLDWEALARGMRWEYLRAAGAAELRRALPSLDAIRTPTLIHYAVPKDELGPDFLLTLRRTGVAV